MNVEDLQLRLLAKLPIYVDNIPIYSPELIDVADVGVEEYQKMIGVCTIDKDSLNTKIEEKIDDFDILILFITQQKDFLANYLKSLKFFTKKQFEVAEQNNDLLFFYVEKLDDKQVYRIINRDNYKDFVRAVKVVNCIDNGRPIEELDEFDRRVLEMERKIKEMENKNSESIPFKDLVSSVANMDSNNLNILNIWQINMLTFYDQMKRGQSKEAYIIGLKQLLAGAKPEDVNLEYYIRKL